MQVKAILDKVVKDQPDALAVLVRHGDYDYQNLQSPYDMIASDEILGTVSNVYDLTDSLEAEGYQIGDMILSFDNHSVVSRKIDGGAIIVLSSSLARPQLIKLQVGLGLYVRALEKALASEPAEDEPETAPVEAAPAEAAASKEELAPPVQGSVSAQNNGIAKGFGRILGKAFGGDGVASTSNGPTQEEIDAALAAGKKVRHYRGRAYIE